MFLSQIYPIGEMQLLMEKVLFCLPKAPEILNEYDSPIMNNVSTNEFLPTEKAPYFKPTNDQLYIESEIPIENVKVYNLFGQLVKEANTTNLVLSNLPQHSI